MLPHAQLRHSKSPLLDHKYLGRTHSVCCFRLRLRTSDFNQGLSIQALSYPTIPLTSSRFRKFLHIPPPSLSHSPIPLIPSPLSPLLQLNQTLTLPSTAKTSPFNLFPLKIKLPRQPGPPVSPQHNPNNQLRVWPSSKPAYPLTHPLTQRDQSFS